MKVTIVCGFLGAGKTTFLRQVLQGTGEKTAVLVNELGEVGIDGAVVREGSNLAVVELPTGCICCSLRTDLVRAVKEILDTYHPDRLVIEPTGIAAPSGIVEALSSPEIASRVELEAVIGIVDASNFLRHWESEMFGNFFRDQVMNSDVLLANKADLVRPELLQATVDKLQELNPRAVVIPTSFCRVERPLPVGGDREDRSWRPFPFEPHLDTLSLTSRQRYQRASIEGLLQETAAGRYGEIIRAKGVFNTPDAGVKFDLVFTRFTVEPFPPVEESKFVFIGRGIRREALRGILLREE